MLYVRTALSSGTSSSTSIFQPLICFLTQLLQQNVNNLQVKSVHDMDKRKLLEHTNSKCKLLLNGFTTCIYHQIKILLKINQRDNYVQIKNKNTTNIIR